MNIPTHLCPLFWFHKDETCFPCKLDDNDDFNDVAAIYFYHDTTNNHITYVMHYKQAGVRRLEFVRTFHDSQGVPTRHYLSGGHGRGRYVAHSAAQGTNRQTVYVALNTHAMLPMSHKKHGGKGKLVDLVDAMVKIETPWAVRQRLGPGHMGWFASTEDLEESAGVCRCFPFP